MFSLIYLLLLPLLWGLSSSQSSNQQSLLLPHQEANAYSIMVSLLKVQKPPSVYDVCKTKQLARGIAIECENQPNSTIQNVVSISMVGLALNGVLPPFSLSRFTHLRTLYLYANQIEGQIPESLGKLSELAKLDLSMNNLQGRIPKSLGNLSSLIYLSLHSNQLNESIPESIGNLKNLKELYLSRNHFTGSLPPSLAGLKSLHNLIVYLNQLSGPIPEFLGTMTSLQQLFFPGNELEGGIPDTYAQLKKLFQFSVAGNNLNGTIPSFVKDWTNIFRLELMGNNFEGPLPQEIFGLPNLYTLWVSDLIMINPSDTFEFPESAKFTSNMWSLILRNCSIGGKIPEYIGNMPQLRYLDLSLNKLTGGIPDSLQNPEFLSKVSFAGNKLNERFPYWAMKKSNDSFQMDISDNELPLDGNTLVDQQIIEDGNTLRPDILLNMNLFGCCSINDDISHINTSLINIIPSPQKIMEAECPLDDYLKDNSLFINCGGDKKFDKYEVDNATSNAYVSPDGKWGYSCAGNFMSTTPVGSYLKSAYLRSTKCAVSPLFETARLCPVSLTYYAFCLRKGKYEVQLHFSEIVYAEEENYGILRDRVFDIYIQNISQRQNVNIKSKVGAPNRPWNETFTVDVKDDSPLKIQLLWAGKGVTNDDPLLNGPLISAITVTPAPKPKNLEPWQIVLIVAASIIFCYLVLLGFSWKMGWLENKEWQNTSIKLRDDATVTVKELIDATLNFTTCEIGKGGFGKVYRVEIRNQILAVKKLYEASNIVVNKDDKPSDTENQLRIESYILKSLEHENLIKFFGSFSRKKLHLLVYEFMDNGSLHSVLFGSKSNIIKLDWETRHDICKGIARGLKYLHEDKAFKIIHRDIKDTNILLDAELKAKICDFGLATIYDPNNCIDYTKKGSDGYTPPEYVQRYIFSDKTDIYSFGVLLFEIVSGQSNAIEKSSDGSEFLLDQAYKFLKYENLIGLVDKSLQIDGSKKEEALRILKLAMMCTHISPAFRPSISEVVSVLEGERHIRQISSDLLPMDSCRHCGGTGMLPKTSSSASKMSGSGSFSEQFVIDEIVIGKDVESPSSVDVSRESYTSDGKI